MSKNVLKWLLIVIILMWSLTPIYWTLKGAFQTPADISVFPPQIFPHSLTLLGPVTILGMKYITKSGTIVPPAGQAEQVIRGLFNSFIVAVIVTIITMALIVPLSYVFGRLEFPHKRKLFFTLLLSVAIPPVSTLIPFYVLFIRIGLSGTLVGMVIVTLTITIPFLTWMMVGFFRNLPRVEPLARIDGFSRMQTFLLILLPMAKVGIAVGAVIAFLFSWNEYTFAQILVNGTPATTIPSSISGFLFQHPEPEQLAAALGYSLVPPFLVAFLLQRHITKMNIVEPL